MSEAMMYTLRDVPSRLEPIAEIVLGEGSKAGFYEFELERTCGVSSLALYVNDDNRVRLHAGMKCLSYLQDNRNVWSELADSIVEELLGHEKNGHLIDGPLSSRSMHHRMERIRFDTASEEAYMIFERQANLNELCLDRETTAGLGGEAATDALSHKIAVKLWSKAVYTPARYIEYLVRHDELKSLCASRSFVQKLAKQNGIEEKVKSVSYAENHSDGENTKKIISEWITMYLDDVYPWLKDGFKGKWSMRCWR